MSTKRSLVVNDEEDINTVRQVLEDKGFKVDSYEDPRLALENFKPDITTVFTLCVEGNGFQVDVFNDPIQALSGFKSGLYDLTLIDYKMPNMNGFELYFEINKKDDKVKMCFVTAFEVYYEVLKKKFHSSLNASPPQLYRQKKDVKCFIQKPIDIGELVKRIKEEVNS
jgi:DNA-binding response OmpR family regulator